MRESSKRGSVGRAGAKCLAGAEAARDPKQDDGGPGRKQGIKFKYGKSRDATVCSGARLWKAQMPGQGVSA